MGSLQGILVDQNLVPLLVGIGIFTLIATLISYLIVRRANTKTPEPAMEPVVADIKNVEPAPTVPIEIPGSVVETPLLTEEVSSPFSARPSAPTMGVGSGFKFGFGFAAGVLVFNIMLFILGMMFFNAFITSVIKGVAHPTTAAFLR